MKVKHEPDSYRWPSWPRTAFSVRAKAALKRPHSKRFAWAGTLEHALAVGVRGKAVLPLRFVAAIQNRAGADSDFLENIEITKQTQLQNAEIALFYRCETVVLMVKNKPTESQTKPNQTQFNVI